METTVAAVATPSGHGGLGTVRISGVDAFSIADKVFCSVSARKIADTAGYRALFGKVVNDGEAVDEAVALVFRAPKSYTGENVVEISVHGGDFVVNRVLRAVLDAGAVLAEPGEFTKRAYLNGKMDLSQAEAVMDIISAEGDEALRAGLEQLGGAVTKKCLEIKEKMTFAAATVAAFSDFPDEEPEFSGIDKLGSRLEEIKAELEKLVSDYDVGRMVKNGINAVIVGPPNAGKSTLMNLLSGFEKSIVTPVAGTTRDVVEETVNLGSVTLKLCDTAGIRDTEDTVEKIGVERSRSRMDTADLVLAVFDGSDGFTAEDEALSDSLNRDISLVVFNKSDKGQPDVSPAEERGLQWVAMSAENGTGLDKLQEKIMQLTKTANLNGKAAVYLNERQRNCAKRSLKCINEAIDCAGVGFTVDAVGVLIDDALSALMEITGERVTVEVANEVFKRFCVGK